MNARHRKRGKNKKLGKSKSEKEQKKEKKNIKNSPCFCMTDKNLIMTLELGLMRTWRLPAFSALLMAFSASLRTLVLTILAIYELLGTEILRSTEELEMRYLYVYP